MPSHGNGPGNVVVSWTGGKDGCYACYLAMAAGYRVTHLLHFRNPDRPGSHEINPAVVRAQADALGIPLVQRDAPAYEPAFTDAVRELRATGERIDGAVFGHIETHRPLVERICRDLGLDLLLPLWQRDSREIIAGIVDAGFEVIIASARDDLMGEEWLGRRIDRNFVRELAALDGAVDPCGENGEFHTLVTDGPNFSRRIEITRAERVLRNGYRFLDIREFVCRER